MTFVNPGFNILPVWLCNASAPSSATCVIDSPDVVDCGWSVPSNATSTLEVPFPVSGVVLQYHSPLPFSWHVLQSTPAIVFNWSDPSHGGSAVLVPYPANGTLLCDSSADCVSGATCNTQMKPPRCSTAVPSPPPPYPSQPPLPTPSAAPAAATCNVTGSRWAQKSLLDGMSAHATRVGHEGDAFYTFVPAANGSLLGVFTYTCSSGKNLCVGGQGSRGNGTLELSLSGNSLKMTPAGAAPLTGIVNSTYSCTDISLLSGVGAPVDINNYSPPPATPLDLHVSVATWLSPPVAAPDGAALVATGIAVLSAPGPGVSGLSMIVVAGNGVPVYPGVTPQLLLNASANSNATLVVLTLDVTAPVGTAPAVARVVKLGGRIDHVRSNAAGTVAVAGDFGIAVISGLAGAALEAGGSPAVLVWSDALVDTEPGSCGVCCNAGASGASNTTCRVDIGDDGVVAAALASSDAVAGLLWAAYSPAGVRFLGQGRPGAASMTGVFVDAARAHIGVSYFYNSYTGQEPMVMPAVDVFSYALPNPSPVHDYRLFDWSATVYRQPGPCDGNVADGRIQAVRAGRDGTLLVAGRSDGGNSPFYCGMRDHNRVTTFVQIDEYTQSSNMQSQAITNMMRVDAISGEAIIGQLQLARLSSSGGNTLLTPALQSDATGTIYELQDAGCCLPAMGNQTINGEPLAGPGDSIALLVLPPDMNKRLAWTHFVPASAGTSNDHGNAVDIDVRGGTVALAMNANGPLVEFGALPGTGVTTGGPQVGYIVVLPTLGG